MSYVIIMPEIQGMLIKCCEGKIRSIGNSEKNLFWMRVISWDFKEKTVIDLDFEK